MGLDLKQSLRVATREESVTLVFCDSRYLPVLENWLCFYNQYEPLDLLLVALDDSMSEAMLERGIASYRLKWDGNLDSLWASRVRLIREVLSLGYDVVHSDADAVWLEDPRKFLEKVEGDLIFSQGTIWPETAYKQWGFVLCCGFFQIRATPGSKTFVDQWLTGVEKDPDDQRVLNNLLLQRNLEWEKESGYFMSYKGNDFCCFKRPLSGKGEGLQISLLPHSSFQRVPEKKRAFVKHLISGKSGESSMEVLKRNNCWK